MCSCEKLALLKNINALFNYVLFLLISVLRKVYEKFYAKCH